METKHNESRNYAVQFKNEMYDRSRDQNRLNKQLLTELRVHKIEITKLKTDITLALALHQ